MDLKKKVLIIVGVAIAIFIGLQSGVVGMITLSASQLRTTLPDFNIASFLYLHF